MRSIGPMICAWRYRAGVPGRESVDPAELRQEGEAAAADGSTVVWVDMEDPTEEERDTLKHQLLLDPTVIEALAHPKERTKLVRYGDYFHVAVHDAHCAGSDFTTREVDIVMGPGWMVTVRHPGEDGERLDVELVEHRFELQRSEHSVTEEGFLLWALFDVIVDRYFEVTDAFDDRLDALEEAVFKPEEKGASPRGIPRDVFAIRRDLMEFRRAAAPIREVVNSMIRKEVAFVSEPAIVHFHDIYDRVLRIVDLVESQRDLLTGLLEADLAVISNRLNMVMKKMTSWGAILIVATLIAGIYGMNFRHMPELHWKYGYGIALGMMAVSTFVLYRIFKKKDWL
ncbi:MAG: magnesium/cobalt transporter CorA [Acidimicrobiia bacterium]